MDEILDAKLWVSEHDSLNPSFFPLPERLQYELAVLGFERIRLRQIEPRPVWNFTAKLGPSDSVRDVQIALKRIAKEIGFRLRISEIVAFVHRDRVGAAFCLDLPWVVSQRRRTWQRNGHGR